MEVEPKNCERDQQIEIWGIENTCSINLVNLYPKLKNGIARLSAFAEGKELNQGSAYLICSKNKDNCALLTAEHVVSGADKIEAEFRALRGKPRIELELGPVDLFNDLAVLVPKGSEKFPEASKALKISAREARPKDPAFVLGHASGSDEVVISPGWIHDPSSVNTEDYRKNSMIGQITIDSKMDLAHGSSGSPKFNKYGFVVGTVVAANLDEEGRIQGSAVPNSHALKLLKQHWQAKK